MNFSNNILKEICIQYFKDFSNKNLFNLRNSFSEDIILRDWEIEESGVDQVIKVISNIFSNNETIDIKPINFIIKDQEVSAEIEIVINKKELLRVVDIIRFNDQNKIYSINAYKG